jgi:tetratricopeptide (TPR) repeat protein/predicted Ser/Thr protein kinase
LSQATCIDDEGALALLEQRVDDTTRRACLAHAVTCPECRELLAELARVIATAGPDLPMAEDRIGPYTLRHRLGRGGMGEVWLARDDRLARDVAIKLLRHVDGGNERFLREARILARMVHPNIVAIHNVGSSPLGVWIAMELVDGETLATWVRGRGAHEILAAYRQAGLGLAHAHRSGVVHRDFKPHNVMIGRDGRVRVLDFGLAAMVGAPASAASASGPGESTLSARGGTLGYMSPEQLLEQPSTPKSDQFAFCVALWEALTGSRPFVGDSPAEIAMATLEGRPQRRSRLDLAIERALRRGLAREPSERYSDIDALLAALAPLRPRWRRGAIATMGVACCAWWAWPSAPACERTAMAFDARTQALAARAPDHPLLAHARAWADTARASCAAPPALAQCVEERRAEIEVALARAEDGEPAPVVLAAVLPMQRCDEPSSVAPSASLDPALTEEIAACSRRVATLRATIASDPHGDHEIAALALVERADALAWPPLQARARALLGQHASKREDWHRAAEAFEAAYHLAREADDTDTEFDAAFGMMPVYQHLAEPELGLVWARHAEAALARLSDPLRRTRWLKLRGELRQTVGRLDEAELDLRDAVATMPADAPDEDRGTATALLANLLAAQWRCEEAVPLYDAALAQELPAYARTLVMNGLAVCAVQRQDFETAEQMFAGIIDEAERGGLGAHVQLTAKSNLAIAYGEQKQYGRALALLHDIWQMPLLTSFDRNEVEVNLALYYLRSGDHGRAASWALRVLEDPAASPRMSGKAAWTAKEALVAMHQRGRAYAVWQRRVALDLAQGDLEDLPDDLLAWLELADAASAS